MNVSVQATSSGNCLTEPTALHKREHVFTVHISTVHSLNKTDSTLYSLFSHFWSRSRSLRPSSSVSFGWWQGKIAGDTRSYAQVVAAP
jgi:hypothetical protein